MHLATRCTGLLLVAAVVTAGAGSLATAGSAFGPRMDAPLPGNAPNQTDDDTGRTGLSDPGRRIVALLPEAPGVRPGNPLRHRHPARSGGAVIHGFDPRHHYDAALHAVRPPEPEVVVRHPARRRHCPPEIPDAA